MSDYPDAEPAELGELPTSGGFGFVPPHDAATGEVLDGVIVDADPPADGSTTAVLVAHELADAGGVAMHLLRDPELVRELSTGARAQLLRRVDDLAAIHRAERPRGRVTPAMLAPELNALSDAYDVLDTIAGVFTDGAKRSRRLVGEVTHELADDPRRGSTSVKVADSHGSDLKVTRTQPTRVVVSEDELIDVLVADLVRQASPERDQSKPYAGAVKAFADGVRSALTRYRQLTTAHSFKTTALDEWGRDLDAAEEHELSIRLGHAYGRVSHGEPTVKIDRVSRKTSTDAGDETAQS